MAKAKKILRRISDRLEARTNIQKVLNGLADRRVDSDLIAQVIETAQGAHKVKYDPAISHTKGVEEGQKVTLATLVAAGLFALVRGSLDLDPALENWIGGGISIGVAAVFAYIRQRIANKKKIKDLEE